MISITDNVQMIFDEVLFEISQNIRSMMEELWLNWSHLGVDDNTKLSNITKLVQIEKALHRDVLLETRQQLKIMQEHVDKLKEETEELSRCLSVDITMMDYKDDMMLVEYRNELEEQIAGYREQVEQCRKKMEHLLQWQRDLTETLGVTMQQLPDVPLPSEGELDSLKNHLKELQAERDKRAEIFLNTQVEIKDIMEKLQIKPQNKFEHLVVTSLSVDFKFTDQNMDRLATLQQDLQEKYECTNNRVLVLREQLTKLWECLEEDHIYRENFLHAHPGCHQHTEAAIKDEIKRCNQIKMQKKQVFVANVRTKIKLMWDNIMYSSQQRGEFLHYFQDHFTEDTLTLHEHHLEKITKFYNENKQIFDLVETRKNLWTKMTELEARESEPGRYQNRGGQLLREERDRKAIASSLQKIEAQLRDLVKQYEERTRSVFTVDGKPLVQQIEEDWENRKAMFRIFDSLETRKNLWTKMTELEARESEPGRYQNRGGQLLREERDRKAIGSSLPKIEAQLRDLVKQYEERTRSVFTVDGKPLVQQIEEDWENRKAERHKKLSARKEALTPMTSRGLAVSPLKRNRTAAGLPATADRHRYRAASKRQLVTGSATKAMSSVSTNLCSVPKRSAVTIVKRRISGRLEARAVAEIKGEHAKRKLDYGVDQRRTPKIAINGSILKYKRTSHSKPRSSRHSLNATQSIDDEPNDKDPLMESTLLTTYTDFKDGINEEQISRSSFFNAKPSELVLPPAAYSTIEETKTPETPKKTPKFPTPLTPKVGKDNNPHLMQVTPKNKMPYTPTRLTRSTMKVNDGFTTPLSANKVNLQRQNTVSALTLKNTPEMARSKSDMNIIRVKKLPPLI